MLMTLLGATIPRKILRVEVLERIYRERLRNRSLQFDVLIAVLHCLFLGLPLVAEFIGGGFLVLAWARQIQILGHLLLEVIDG